MDALLNSLKVHAAAMDAAHGRVRIGTVQSVNPADYTARVLIQPEGVLSGWLPMATQKIGAGWGIVAPHSPGDQVVVLAQEGDAENGIIVGGIFNDQARAPTAGGSVAASGEIALVHKSGAYLKLNNSGHIFMQDAGGCSLEFKNNGTATLTGTLHVTGTIINP